MARHKDELVRIPEAPRGPGQSEFAPGQSVSRKIGRRKDGEGSSFITVRMSPAKRIKIINHDDRKILIQKW